MLRTKSGDRLHRHVIIKLFLPLSINASGAVMEWDKVKIRRYRAPAHQGFTADGIAGMCEQTINELDRAFPALDFRMVQVGPAQFNFLYDKLRTPPCPPPTPPPQ